MQKAIDELKINAAACEHLSAVLTRLMDYKGYASADVTRLGDRAAPIRLTEWRVGPYGDWRCSGDGSSGGDLIELVSHLGRCDRQTAASFLAGLVERVAA